MMCLIVVIVCVILLLAMWAHYGERIEELEDEALFDLTGVATIHHNGKELSGEYFIQPDGSMLVFVDEEIFC